MHAVWETDHLMIERTLLWTPRTKGRPRTIMVGKGYRTYTPHETVEAEASLRQQWVGPPMSDDLSVTLEMYDDHIDLMLAHTEPPLSPKLRRGDIDNYAKLIMDALNGVAWVDDRQIASLIVHKM